MEALDVFDDLLSMEDHEFQAWIVDQGLTDMEKSIWCFHYWLRNESELSHSTCVDYRRDVASNWKKDPSDEHLKSQEKSALNKFEKFQKSDFMEAMA